MGPPTPESLAGMGLLGKKESVITEVLFLRDDTLRKQYYDQFYAANGGVDEFKQVKWYLEISITGYICKPTKFYDQWTEEASEKVTRYYSKRNYSLNYLK